MIPSGNDTSGAFRALTHYIESDGALDQGIFEVHRGRIQIADATASLKSCFVGDPLDQETRNALFRLHLASYPKGLDYLSDQDSLGTLGDDAMRVLHALCAETREQIFATPQLACNGMIVLPLPDTNVNIVLHPQCMRAADGFVTSLEADRLIRSKADVEEEGGAIFARRMLKLKVSLMLDGRRVDPLALRTWYSILTTAHSQTCFEPSVPKEDQVQLGLILHSLVRDMDLTLEHVGSSEALNIVNTNCLTLAEAAFERSENLWDVAVVRSALVELFGSAGDRDRLPDALRRKGDAYAALAERGMEKGHSTVAETLHEAARAYQRVPDAAALARLRPLVAKQSAIERARSPHFDTQPDSATSLLAALWGNDAGDAHAT